MNSKYIFLIAIILFSSSLLFLFNYNPLLLSVGFILIISSFILIIVLLRKNDVKERLGFIEL
jgi:hypothetical protein